MAKGCNASRRLARLTRRPSRTPRERPKSRIGCALPFFCYRNTSKALSRYLDILVAARLLSTFPVPILSSLAHGALQTT